jgi:hypothetical protein
MRRWIIAIGMASRVAAADTPASAPAGDDPDLAFVPAELPDAKPDTPPRPHALTSKLYLDNAFTLDSHRDAVVPFPPPEPYDAQNRTSFDLSTKWKPVSRLTFTLSDRFDVVAQNGEAVWSSQTVRNELRESYASWEALTRTYLELGRINVHTGAALGFNPTDFFRPGTLIGQASLDPSVLRMNRLGTMMVRAQHIWSGGSASIAYAPKLFAPPSLASTAIGIDPQLDSTNSSHRALAEVSTNVRDLSVQALAYYEPHRAKLGVNLTQPIGQSVIAYAEWSGGVDQGLVARALDYGRTTGTIPAGSPDPIPADPSRAFRNDLAAGASVTIASTLTVNLEYHFHQGGMARTDWDHWFTNGIAMPSLAPELWYIRAYANAQLEPASMHQVFVRADWPGAIVDHLELSGFAFASLIDGSVLTQVTASYFLSDQWTANVSFGGNFGTARSERGSMPQPISAIVELIRYL